MFLKKLKNTDWILSAAVVLLALLGIVVIYSLTYTKADAVILYNQILFVSVGIILMFAIQLLDYRYLKNFSWLLYSIGVLGLLVVLILGRTTYGATRWIDIGFFRLQPSEFFKLITIISLAAYLSKKELLNLKELFFSLIIIFIPIVLVLLQPDMGTAIIIFAIAATLIISSGILKKHFYSLIAIILGLMPIFWFFILKPYQKSRIITFINPQADPFGSGYHVLQSIIAIGSGMIFGRGLGKGFQSQLKFLPAPHTDFIFAVLCEGMGLVGVVLLLFLFAILIYRLFRLLTRVGDKFGYLIVVSTVSFIVFQLIINIGMNMGIAPVTGIPLPFVSYGGSHIIVTFILIGIIQSVYSHSKTSN